MASLGQSQQQAPQHQQSQQAQQQQLQQQVGAGSQYLYYPPQQQRQVPAQTVDDLEWKFVQSFGDDNSSDDDLVTAVQYDETGEYLAVGDKAGRICIFEGHEANKDASGAAGAAKKKGHPLEYRFYTEFQSHEPEFDCLKSSEIDEKINTIKWAKRRNNALFLLAANDKTIKFWKVHEKKMKRPSKVNANSNCKGEFIIPSLSHYQTVTTASPKRVFSNAHGYHINSISINSDGETFISADDLRINLWNVELCNETFNILDLKPPNLEELTEVVTSASFHPIHCNTLMYSSSRGSIRMVDLRDSALCDNHAKVFEIEEDPLNKSFFSEIISSISDAKFVSDGRYIISRDYLTMKVWDVNMEKKPVSVIPVHEFLKMHLCDLYENDCIFDKFECAASGDGSQFVTGSYNNNFILHNQLTQTSVTIEALKDAPKKKVKPGKPQKKVKKDKKSDVPNVNLMDFGKRALHVAWHPFQHCVAIAGLNKLYIYQV